MKITRNQRRFQLVRSEDETGVSGTGVVGEGCLFSDGSVAFRWMSENSSSIWYGNIQAAIQVHGHGGKTKVHWLDPDLFDVEGVRAKIRELQDAVERLTI